MNRQLWSLACAAMMGLWLAACGGGDAGGTDSGLPGAGEGLPRAAVAAARPELHYGDLVQIKSMQSDHCLADQDSAYAFPMVTTVPQCLSTEPWKIVHPDDRDATAPVRFNDPVALYSPSRQGYLLPDGGDHSPVWLGTSRFDMKLQDASNLNSTANVTFGAHLVITQMWGCRGCTTFLSSRDQGQPGLRAAEMRFQDAERWVVRPARTQLAYWMTEMSSALRDVPLTKMAIPGSHDAGTYSIADGAPFSPDLPLDDLPRLKDLILENPTLAPQVNSFMARFARAQGKSIAEQLNTGVRYFDLRPGASANGDGDELLIVHSLYGGSILSMIDDVAAFLATHPKEVVILDISHFTAMSDRHHAALISRIKTAFDGKLVPAPTAPSADNPRADQYTIGDIQSHGWQVVCIYHDDHAAAQPGLWRYGTPTETKWWPYKPTTGEVKAVLEDRLRSDRPLLSGGSLFVLQTILTPDAPYYSRVFFGLETPKEVMESTVKEAKDKIAILERAVDGRESDIAWLDRQIKDQQDHIADLQHWIDKHQQFWNYFGRKSREAQIGLARLQISGYQSAKSKEKSAITAANTALADAKAKLAEFQQMYLDANATPGSLVLLAEQFNPEMRGWLPGWRDRRLNIVIQDAVDEDFVDAVRRLNQ